MASNERNRMGNTMGKTISTMGMLLRHKIPILVDDAIPQDDYYADEVKEMTMDRIVGEFMRITGREELYCKHCKKPTLVREKWMEAVATRCKRVGIHKEMEVPKTCDKQWLANKKMNPICNPINNAIYRKLVKCAEETGEKNKLIQKRMDGLKEVGIEARPYKYVME